MSAGSGPLDLQAEVSRTAAIVAYRLGYLDLARLALSRMAVAAPQSGDPRHVAIERYERAQMAAVRETSAWSAVSR
ncbi:MULTISPECIES: hypothetical protein [unclassified Streptomyces]|uniref:hypothetical protein n=1 Tax=unclassified Streptomyces TaxID=2593676 RepID=UPI00168AF02A|nr:MULTISPECIES: hypothetical protein [unclassified Streptomyces]MBD3008985.1 hypothetical protein [Streptomyces sp. 5-10]